MKIRNPAISILQLVNLSFNYVIQTSNIYKIDESHALKHSMDVYQYSKNIYNSELFKNSYLKNQENIIYMAAIGHDMCDKKYMNETEGIIKYKSYLSGYMTKNDLDAMSKIINTMSYSKVVKNGYPKLGKYQLAYHIVREADLLSAYDLDRCLIYSLICEKLDYDLAVNRVINIANERILHYRKDNLFVTPFSKRKSILLHYNTLQKVKSLENIVNIL
jgi:hypothetical protein